MALSSSSLIRLSILYILFFVGCSPNIEYDFLIEGAHIYVGDGAAPFEGNVGIKGDEIHYVGSYTNLSAKRVIEANGLAVCPGFIDVHAHLEPLMQLPESESHVRQGVTTALGGPDGGGPDPFVSYLDSLEELDLGMNVAFLVGHNRVRARVMELARRAPTAQEMSQMQQIVQDAMDAGAYGLSTGLKYLPGTFAKTDEVIALAKVAAQNEGIYTSHIREEGLGLLPAVREVIDVASGAQMTAVITHHKAMGQPMWGASSQTLGLVDSAREAGLDVRIDQYPYNASYTGISVLIPSWGLAGGREAFLSRIGDNSIRDSLLRGIVFNLQNDRGGGDLRRVQLARVRWNPEMEGKTLFECLIAEEIEPTLENGAKLVLDIQEAGGASAIYHAMDDQDVDRIMVHPQTMIASDGRLARWQEGHPHPRWYGTFPRVLGHYVREKELLPLETAIHKMTGLPASLLNLDDRGYLTVGFKADIVIFDPQTVIDKATFEKPHQYPEGIRYVFCNGVLKVDQGRFQPGGGGKVLRRNSANL
ncbi:MAG: D-aminoacylase [Bacteroidota bacterium]